MRWLNPALCAKVHYPETRVNGCVMFGFILLLGYLMTWSFIVWGTSYLSVILSILIIAIPFSVVMGFGLSQRDEGLMGNFG
nr:hypothetical protein [uncultured Cohaesibacter sp.]